MELPNSSLALRAQWRLSVSRDNDDTQLLEHRGLHVSFTVFIMRNESLKKASIEVSLRCLGVFLTGGDNQVLFFYMRPIRKIELSRIRALLTKLRLLLFMATLNL